MTEAYRVSLDVYEGPLDLLLFLIRKAEVDIYDIPIARITREYLEYVTLMRELQLEVAGEFFVMAATLMLIKSQMLLPRPVTLELESIEDPRSELIRQLIEYERIQRLSDEMRDLEDAAAKRFPRGIEKEVCEEEELEELTLFDLLSAMQRILAQAEREKVNVIAREELRIEDCIARVRKALQKHPEGLFLIDLLENDYQKVDIIITFISILELWRLGEISVRQLRSYGPITVAAA